LQAAGLNHPLLDSVTFLSNWRRRPLAPALGWNVNVEIDSVEQGAAKSPAVAFDGRVIATTVSVGAAVETTRAWVGGADQHEVGGELTDESGSRQNHTMIFQDLAERLPGSAVELGQFVQQQDTAVGQ